MSLAQHLQRLEDAAEHPRHLGLADAGGTGEDHVLAHGRHGQVLGAALLLHLHPGDDALHLRLHRREADHAVQGRERRGEEVLLLHRRAVILELDRTDLPVRPLLIHRAPHAGDPRRNVGGGEQAADDSPQDQNVAQQGRGCRRQGGEHVRPQGDHQGGRAQHDGQEEGGGMLVEAFHGCDVP
ncbi:hypothetical protein ASF34_19060 [Methylobacterium sp. Leaf106]|nr:hypothetical protein ASF34_19060 [Methylobacterium sp. Leaf106]